MRWWDGSNWGRQVRPADGAGAPASPPAPGASPATQVIPPYTQPQAQGPGRAVATHRRRRRPRAKLLWLAPLLVVAAVAVPVVGHIEGTGNVKTLRSTGPATPAPRTASAASASPVRPSGQGASAAPRTAPASSAASPAGSAATNWYAVGRKYAATAVRDGLTPAAVRNLPGSTWNAPEPATAWCADLVYAQSGTVPASLQAILAQVPQATADVTQFDNGCENGYTSAFGAPGADATSPAPAPVPTGLEAAGQLMVGCKVIYSYGEVASGANLTYYNPGSSSVYVAQVSAQWITGDQGSPGMVQGSGIMPYGNSIAPGQVVQIPVSRATAVVANYCLAGWS